MPLPDCSTRKVVSCAVSLQKSHPGHGRRHQICRGVAGRGYESRVEESLHLLAESRQILSEFVAVSALEIAQHSCHELFKRRLHLPPSVRRQRLNHLPLDLFVRFLHIRHHTTVHTYLDR